MKQRGLFDEPTPAQQKVEAPDAELLLFPELIPAEAGQELLRTFIRDVPWRQDTVRVFGRQHFVPRLQQWFGEPNKVYTWSGIRMEPLPWTEPILRVKAAVEAATGREFDSVLLNFYRNGTDTVGWHADDEPELGLEPEIASVSLGAERDFVLRHKDPAVPRLVLTLPHGSLLLMSGPTQVHWKHTLPRRKGVLEPRVNLTFRNFSRATQRVAVTAAKVKQRKQRGPR